MDKKITKRYLKWMMILFVVMFVVSAIIIFGIYLSDKSSLDSISQGFLYCLICAILPIFACNGFATIYGKIKGMATSKPVLFVLLVLPITIFAIPIGAVMLIPMMIKNIKIILDK